MNRSGCANTAGRASATRAPALAGANATGHCSEFVHRPDSVLATLQQLRLCLRRNFIEACVVAARAQSGRALLARHVAREE